MPIHGFMAQINLVSTSPPDLTPYIVKTGHQYVAGGAFGDVYRCRYLNGSTSEDVSVIYDSRYPLLTPALGCGKGVEIYTK